jgi:peptidoglycan/xylan/chitin deacetylase (PgdA/CDA1 family)
MTVTQFRTDRFGSLYLARPLRRLAAGKTRQRVPILMYHSISDGIGERAHPYFVTETSAKRFAEQMKYLHDNKYCVITLDQLVAMLQSPTIDSNKYAVITFDDGFRDFCTNAFPVLHSYGFRAHMYLPTAFIGHTAQSFKGKECMNWAEVRELQKAGMVFGSHTVTHPQLRSVSPAELDREVRGSKETIERELGAAINSFSYPYAFPEDDREFTRRLRNLIEECGYENGVSTIIGSVPKFEDRFFLGRMPVNDFDDPALFRAKLEGDYDWLRGAQYLRKLLKRQPKQAVEEVLA